MVLQKRLDYGFNGYQVPPTPRATRSARRRRTFRSKGDDNQMCSFDLLATVAGKLLRDDDSSADTSNSVHDSIKKEHYTEPDPKSIGHGICDQSFFVSKLVLQAPVLNKRLKEPLVAQHDACSGPASAITSSASCKLEGDGNKREIKIETFNNGKLSFRDIAEHSVKFPLSGDQIPCGSISVNNEDVKLGSRDDDENSGCTQPSTGNKAFMPIPCNGDRRIKKDDEQCTANYVCHSRKNGFKRQMSLRDYPFKKRRLYYSSLSNPSDGVNGEGICNSPRKCSYSDVMAPVGTSQGVTGPSETSVERASVQPRDSHVKLKIKSFRVPELLIEISETATVGSLKRTVMEAVTAILGGGGVHVGVLLQGKKIRDDNKTLLQTGISRDNKPDALGFILEPDSSSQATPILCSEALPFLLPCDTPEPLKRCLAGPRLFHEAVQHESSDILPDPPANNFNFIESDHDSAPSPPDTSHEQNAVDSRALVVVPSMNPEALSVVPMRKPKKSESAQRRIRRPFSVSEVEALVQAVEKLGTGRWRDVKLRAFDTAKHRTYVDLKDKWKTLVHTARISPQQRRGEPVPQELLDRVLMAHAYWSQQQAKQQLKQHSEACLLL